ncbi:MAG: N-acetylmuramoyl-L-alanine amidase [Kiritimatiellae bacterium]|nr:N-acetylmuramoyl-L-alanine amidase [Kiritimatiellia bacterium]
MKNFCLYLSPVLFATQCAAATPAPNNPYFSWRTLEQAQEQFAASNAVVTAETCIFSNQTSTLIFHNNSRRVLINGVTVWLNVAPELCASGAGWKISAIDMDLIALMLQAKPADKPQPLKIVLDPGHGGDDSGAITPGRDLYEKKITLELARRVGKILRSHGLKVRATRDSDKTLSLNERAAIARKEKADLFVSIHANHAANINACGVETFILTPSGYPGTAEGSPPRGWQIGNKNDYNNNLLGYAIHKQLTGLESSFDRGLKRQSFFVLRETHCPAALIECGFLSNRDEARRMKEHAWQSACAEKIAAGIIDYCHKVNSLEVAVAEKRKKDAEANERWREYLAQKKRAQQIAKLPQVADNKLLPAVTTPPTPLLPAATVVTQSSQPAVTAAAQVQPLPAPENRGNHAKNARAENIRTPAIDLQTLAGNQVQSIATNIYLKNAATGTQPESDSESLKKLAEFYENNKVK